MLFIGINVYYYDHHYTIPALLLGPAPHPTPSVIFQPFLKTVTRPRVYKIISVPELIISHRVTRCFNYCPSQYDKLGPGSALRSERDHTGWSGLQTSYK